MVSPLKIVRDKPLKAGIQITYDANDRLSSFPGQKEIRKLATLELQNQKGNAGKGKWR